MISQGSDEAARTRMDGQMQPVFKLPVKNIFRFVSVNKTVNPPYCRVHTEDFFENDPAVLAENRRGGAYSGASR